MMFARLRKFCLPLVFVIFAPSALLAQSIAEVQTALNRLGFNVGSVDGRPGQQTTRAIRMFQRAYGYIDTGQMRGQHIGALMTMADWVSTRPGVFVVPVDQRRKLSSPEDAFFQPVNVFPSLTYANGYHFAAANHLRTH